MGLEACPVCKKRVSVDAPSCPKCGHPLEAGWGDKAKEERKKANRGLLLFIVILFGLIWYVASDDGPSESSNATQDMSAMEKMSAVFAGSYSPSAIRLLVNDVAKAYGLPGTEESFSRIGSAVVALRKSTGVYEMDILKCVRSTDAAGGISFPDAAAVCATTLSN